MQIREVPTSFVARNCQRGWPRVSAWRTVPQLYSVETVDEVRIVTNIAAPQN